MSDDTTDHLADEETQLRIRLSDLRRRYQDQAQPIIDRLTKIEAMKPPKPTMVEGLAQANALMLEHINARWPGSEIARRAAACVIPARQQGKGHAAQVMQDLAAMIEDAKSEVDAMAGVQDVLHPNGLSITRTWTNEAGDLKTERIAPEDFYAKPEGEGGE